MPLLADETSRLGGDGRGFGRRPGTRMGFPHRFNMPDLTRLAPHFWRFLPDKILEAAKLLIAEERPLADASARLAQDVGCG